MTDQAVVELGRNGKPLNFGCFVCEQQTMEEFIAMHFRGEQTGNEFFDNCEKEHNIKVLRMTALKLPFTYKLCGKHAGQLHKYLLETYPEIMKQPFNYMVMERYVPKQAREREPGEEG